VPKAIFVVKSSPSNLEREAEYNDWYDNTHVPQVRALPGFVGARRYRQSPPGPDAAGLPTYLIVYDIDHDDPGAALAGLRRGVADGSIDASDAVATSPAPEAALYHLLDA
jgi:hypothetical protein